MAKNIAGLSKDHPVLVADMDGDNVADLVYPLKDKSIYAIRLNGETIQGFPLWITNPTPVYQMAIDDLDNNGKSDIVVIARDLISAWETNGNASKIEWGMERHNAHKTGEYHKICEPLHIRSNTNWTTTSATMCSNVIVESGQVLTMNSGTVNFSNNSTIIVKKGAHLVINGGTLYNANIRALSGSTVTHNGGTVKLRTNGALDIQAGASYDAINGSVEY
jgi:hypothetical protein